MDPENHCFAEECTVIFQGPLSGSMLVCLRIYNGCMLRCYTYTNLDQFNNQQQIDPQCTQAVHETTAHPKKEVKRTPCGSGVQLTEYGEPYISGWPVSRQIPDLGKVPRQSVTEAAHWCSKAP